MKAILDLCISFANWFWGIPILIVIGGTGLYLCIRLGFPQFRHFGYICSQTFGKMFSRQEKKDGTVSPFAAACTALACTIGASNIVGVPVAIALGGPGSVFWIWILAIVGMVSKYAEAALSVKHRVKNEDGVYVGGPYYYCKKGFGNKFGVILGTWFAAALMIEFIPSAATQAASACIQFEFMGIDQKVVAIVMCVLLVIVCMGGVQRIGSVCDKLVPAMAIIYLLGALIIIFANIGTLPGVIGSIFANAFTGRAAVGGFGGATVAMAIRWGAARGVYSNEACVGTGAIGHAASDVDHPIRQANWGVFEVTVDTIIVCTVTALAVLCTGVWTSPDAGDGGTLAQAAFVSMYGAGFTQYFIAICVFLFVFSTNIAIVFYGEKQAEALFGTKFAKVWRWIYIIGTLIGGFGVTLSTLYSLLDFLLAIVIIPNVLALLLLAPQVKKLQHEFYHTPGMYYLADKAAKESKKSSKTK